jgi:hypothetical protein
MANDRGYTTLSTSPNEISSSPRTRPTLMHIGSLKGFLPLNEDATISTRGQYLPSLLRNRSGTNLSKLGASFDRKASLLSLRRNSEDIESGPAVRDENASAEDKDRDRRMSAAMNVLMTPQMRSQRLIGNSNPRYKWERYWKSDEQLKKMRKPIRKYYERCNSLIQQYTYIDRLLDSSLPHNLIQEYSEEQRVDIPPTISEEGSIPPTPNVEVMGNENGINGFGTPLSATSSNHATKTKLKRTPKNLYRLPDDETPLLRNEMNEETEVSCMPDFEPEDEADNQSPIVTFAIYLNLAANTILLILKIIVTVLTSSVSVLASLVDAALDFLSTGIVWTTTRLIARRDQYAYPIGRRRLEPIGVLVFSVIMITSFVQVALEGLSRLTSGDHSVVQLSIPAVAIMASTVVIKFGCWLWCRFIRNSSVQALAQDAMTDVVFNIFSIIFPLSKASTQFSGFHASLHAHCTNSIQLAIMQTYGSLILLVVYYSLFT